MNFKLIFEAIALFFTCMGLTFVFVPINIRIAKLFGLIDHPHDRGVHKKIMPLAGGISVIVPIILALIFVYFKNHNLAYRNQFIELGIGAFGIGVVGLLDDKYEFSAKYKLIWQILISTVMYFFGYKISLLTNPFGSDIVLGFLSFPVTIIWFVLVMNAFNLIDGLDGLATGIAIIVFLVLFCVGLMYNNPIIYISSIVLMGSLIAFLFYNFYPAKIFLGDTGSLFLGFMIAAISIAGTGQIKGITAMTLLIPIVALFIPLADTFLAIFRRIRRRRNIFAADKEHIHHKLLELNLSQKAVAILSYFVTFLFGLIALGFSFANKRVLFITMIMLGLLLIIFLYLLLKKEFFK